MSGSLKPCPFCGAPAEIVHNGPTKEQVAHAIAWAQDVDDGGSFIHCTKCDAATALHFDRRENLESSWNDRVHPLSASGFLPEDAAHVAELLRSSDEAGCRAVMSNNFNLILAALSACGEAA